MGVIKAIVALLRAVPSLERLFLKVADGVREANAKARYNAKLSVIDSAMQFDGVRDNPGTEWSAGVDRSPVLPEGETMLTRVEGLDEGGS